MVFTRRVQKIFVFLGYSFLVLQFVWLAVLVGGLFVNSDTLREYAASQPAKTTALPIEYPAPVAAIVTAVVTILVVVLALAMMIRAPQTAGEMTVRSVESATKKVEPVIQKKLHVKTREKKTLHSLLVFAIQIALSMIIFVATLFAAAQVHELPQDVSHTVGVFLFLMSLAGFVASYGMHHIAQSLPKERRNS